MYSHAKRYYYCDASRSPTPFSCPDGYAFDPALPDIFPCKFTANLASSCIKADCSKTDVGKIYVMKYPSLPSNLTLGQIAVLCFGGQADPVVFRTGAYTSLASVDENLEARYNIACPSEGFKLPDNSAATKYNVCVIQLGSDLGSIKAKSFTCFGGRTYDKDKQTCV